jgi:hypothetical protein
LVYTVDSRYNDTDGIRKMYQYNQTINITSLNFYCLGMVGIKVWYGSKQYFVRTDIIITSLLYVGERTWKSGKREDGWYGLNISFS